MLPSLKVFCRSILQGSLRATNACSLHTPIHICVKSVSCKHVVRRLQYTDWKKTKKKQVKVNKRASEKQVKVPLSIRASLSLSWQHYLACICSSRPNKTLVHAQRGTKWYLINGLYTAKQRSVVLPPLCVCVRNMRTTYIEFHPQHKRLFTTSRVCKEGGKVGWQGCRRGVKDGRSQAKNVDLFRFRGTEKVTVKERRTMVGKSAGGRERRRL